MDGLLLQDFVTARAAAGSTLVQSSTSWLDLGNLEDLVLYTDCREALNGVQLGFDTAPTPLESQFTSLIPLFTLATGLQTNIALASFTRVPPARYLRWRLSAPVGATSQATFRVLVAGYKWA